jgi:hypothetical protein
MRTHRLNSLRRIISLTLAGGGLIVAGCELPQMDEGDFGQTTMQRHYENGEMNSYEYQTGSQVFKPRPTAPDATDAAKPAASADSGKPADPPAIKY